MQGSLSRIDRMRRLKIVGGSFRVRDISNELVDLDKDFMHKRQGPRDGKQLLKEMLSRPPRVKKQIKTPE